MDCRECSDLLYEYLDNELDTEARRRLESHLSGCAACRGEWREIRESLALYRRHITAETPGGDFAAGVMAKLAAEQAGFAVPLPLSLLGVSLLALFVLALLALLPFFYPVAGVLAQLLLHLMRVPGIMLAAFPAMQFTSLSLLAVSLAVVTWATRRAISY